MPVKQARQQATHTPWEVISRIPLNKAQEIKVLLETSRATVRLQGMDIWEDHEESDEHEEQDNSGASRNKFKKKLLLWCSIILSCALITAIIVYTINYEQGRRKGLLGNIQVDIPETFSEKPDVSGESGSDKEIEEISSEPEADMPDITEPGFSPVIKNC